MLAEGRRALWIVLLVGTAVRLLHLLEQPTFPEFHRPEVDAWYYHLAAQQIAAGDWGLGHETLRMSPGYFYVLGSLYSLFGAGPWAPRLVQIALGLGLIALLWDTTRRWLGPRYAPWPALAAALYGPFVYFEGHLLAESIGAFTHVLLAWLLVRTVLERAIDARRWLAVGLAWGACCVMRPNALPLIVAVLYALVVTLAGTPLDRNGGRVSKATLALVLGAMLMIGPIAARNLIAAGEPVLLTSHAGLNLYVGNGPGATGTFRIPRDVPLAGSPLEQYQAFHARAEQALGHTLSARESDSYWVKRTLRAIAADPLAFARITVRKLHLFWNGRELHNVYDYEFARVIGVVLGGPLVQFGYLAPFALLGVLVLLLRPGVDRMLALLALFACGGVVVAFVTDRYRLPFVGLGLLCAIGGVRAAVDALRARRRSELAAMAVIFAMGVGFAIPVQVNKRMHEKYFKYGSAFLDLGDAEYAAWGFIRSLEAKPGFLPSHEKLAELYERAGATDRLHAELRDWERAALASGKPAEIAKVRAAMERNGMAP